MLIDMPHIGHGGIMDGLLLFKREQDKTILEVIQNTLAQNTARLIGVEVGCSAFRIDDMG